MLRSHAPLSHYMSDIMKSPDGSFSSPDAPSTTSSYHSFLLEDEVSSSQTTTPLDKRLCNMLGVTREVAQRALKASHGDQDDAASLIADQLERLTMATQEPDEEADRKLCLVCIVAPRAIRLNCGHKTLCQECFDTLRTYEQPCCPTCREPVAVGLFPLEDGLLMPCREKTYVAPEVELENALDSDDSATRTIALDHIFNESGSTGLMLTHQDSIAKALSDHSPRVKAAAARVARKLVKLGAGADDKEERLAAARMTATLPLAAM